MTARGAPWLVAAAALAGCASDHHVSPFVPVDAAALLRPMDDLPAQLARVDAEARALGLQTASRVEGALPGGEPIVALGLVGRDLSGRVVHAVRVVTPAAIVLALGPTELGDPRRAAAPVELVESVLPGGGFPSCRDLTGDGTPDVVARAPDGALAVYSATRLGATRMPVACAFSPTTATDANADGRMDLVCRPPRDEGDPLAPELLDVAIGVGVAFDHDHPDAVAFHRDRVERRAAAPDAAPDAQLRALLEVAFARVRAGEQPEEIVADLDRRAARWLVPGWREAWMRHRRAIVERARPPRR